MDARHLIPWLCWERLLCMDKGSSLNLDLMVSSNYVLIMIMLMSIYVYMYACHFLTRS